MKEVDFSPNYWRTVLFVPAHIDRFVEAAHTRGADAIQLDLEDSIPFPLKPSARQCLPNRIELLEGRGVDILIRINRELNEAILDLEVAVNKGVSAITIPKVMGHEHLRLLDEVITTIEKKKNLPVGHIKMIAMIESVDALLNIQAIAHACKRLEGLTLGSEDFSLDAGFKPTEDNLYYPCQKILYAARSAGIQAYGFPGSIADYNDLGEFKRILKKAKGMGFMSSFCIHPCQVSIINDVFSVSEEEAKEAEEIVNAFDHAHVENVGVIALNGKMIDLPVVERARELLFRAGARKRHCKNK
jgi:citrate lyase subunit beta/citryl-CoA lyase